MAELTTHGMFRLERTYDASPARVFAAFGTAEGKEAWFSAPNDQWTLVERSFDFRVGGKERLVGRWKSGMVTSFDATYFDIKQGERIVYTYEMRQDDRKISVSLATIEVQPEGSGAKLVVTEQGAFLDGYEDNGSREHGTGILLDRVGESLK